MRTVRITREDFIAKVSENRQNHRSIFDAAVTGYRARMIKELERRLHDVRRGHAFSGYLSLPEPEDHTEDYDRVLEMATLSVDELVELSEDEFSMYVMDQWNWTNAFTSTTERYTSTR